MIQNLVQHYKVLGLEPGASLEEVNQAYKDLVFIWHPDRVPQDNERLVKKSVEKIQQINEARDSLRNYHRKHKSASKQQKSKAPAKQAYSHNTAKNSPPSSRSTAYDRDRANNSQSKSSSQARTRQPTYTRPHEKPRQSYQQASNWNYRDYYSSASNPDRSTKKDGYRDFRQTDKISSGYARPAETAHRRPYSQDLRGADLSKSNFKEKDFSGRDLSEADLSYSDLSDTFLHKIILESANLQGANLKGANLLQANLRNADLREANLIGADLSGSDLSGANLSGAKVGFQNKIMVKITAVKLTGATLPDGSIHP